MLARIFYSFSLLLLSLGGIGTFQISVSHAAEMSEHAKSLAAVPADSSFYAAWLKNGEQFEAMQQSSAWQKLMTIPALQMGLMQANTWWQFPPDEKLVVLKEWIESSEGQKVGTLLGEMVSEEIFVLGDGSLTELIKIGMDINSQLTRNSFQRLEEKGDLSELDNDAESARVLIESLRKHRESIRVPTLVKGFRIQNKELAIECLDLLHSKLRTVIANANLPFPLLDNLQRTEVDGHNLMTFTISSDMLPWGKIEEELDDSPELYEILKEVLDDEKVVLTWGVVDQFVVISVSNSPEIFQGLGEGQLLADSQEFQRLNRHADQRVVSLGYMSREFMQAINSSQKSFDDLAVTAKGFLTLADLEDDLRKSIEKDIDALASDIVDCLPEPGAVAVTTFWTDQGYESFSYYWGKLAKQFDSSKPLTIIDHLGDQSIGWLVGRGNKSVEDYDRFVSWLKRGFQHVEAVVEMKSSEKDKKEIQNVREQILPLLRRLDTANREMLIPGTVDGQGAIVFDATSSDDQWCQFMPEANQDLPLPTLAMVYGVSDSNLVKRGAAEYFDVFQDVVDLAYQANPNKVPKISIPEPTIQEITDGHVYSYDLPKEWGASEQISPNATLSDSVLVLSFLPELSRKLLDGPGPQTGSAVAEFDRPLAYASHFKCAQFIRLLKPWIDYGIQLAIENADEDAAAAIGMVGFVKPQVYQFLDVLQALDSYTSVTYLEDDVWVTHGELRLIDTAHE